MSTVLGGEGEGKGLIADGEVTSGQESDVAGITRLFPRSCPSEKINSRCMIQLYNINYVDSIARSTENCPTCRHI